MIKFPFFRIVVPAALLGLFHAPAQADPTGSPDVFSVSEDGVLFTIGSVLANDSPDPGGSLTASVVTPPANGRLVLDADGTFSYVPNPDFSGADSFTYVAKGNARPQTFTVVQGSSNVTVNANLNVDGVGSDTDSDNSSISGTMLVNLAPASPPFGQIQVQDVDLKLADGISLHFTLAKFFGAEIAGVDANAAPNALAVTMDSPGASAAVNGGGAFSQTANTLRITGVANVDGTGLADGQFQEGDIVFDSPVENVDFNGTVVESGGIVTLTVPLNFDGVFPIEANTLTLNLTGTIVATAPVSTTTPQSAVTTVTINVSDVNDAPMTQPDVAYVSKNSRIDVSSGQGGTETLVPAGATWRYLDDGSDQGTAWSGFGFNDGAWALGAAELGYGDGETTLISDGGIPAARHITYYFRKGFNVTGARDVGRLLVRLQRDDGAVVYLNGTQVVRSNMPSVFNASTLASGAVSGTDELAFYEFEIDASALYEGGNVIAVEVHQSSADSTDVSFNLELIRTRASGVLANDSDLENNALTASLHTQSANGTASVSSNGSYSFTPQAGFTGSADFLYRVTPTGASPQALLPRGAVWKYLADGTDQGIGWRASAFVDSGWPKGRAKLGYGDGDEATVIGFGPNAGAKFATTYFRNEFYLADPLNAGISMEIRRDDAAAVYVNGTEVFRDAGLTAGALFSEYSSAQTPSETGFSSIVVPPAVLLAGRNVVAVEVHQASASSSDMGFDLAVRTGLPLVTVVDDGSEWSYLDSGADLGTAWRAAAFDDAAWASGPAILGYGEGGEGTVVSFGTNANIKHTTTYFRKSFHIPDASVVKGLLMRYLADDGVAVYLNGTEVLRDRLAAGAAFNALATATVGGLDEYAYMARAVSPAALVNGRNVLAVEVHQSSLSSTDLSFDLEMLAAQTAVVQTVTVHVVNDDTDNDGMSDDYERAFGLIVGVDDSGVDEDGDGQTNLQESYAFTNPFVTASVFKTTAVSNGGGTLTIQFSAVAGKKYTLEKSTDLQNWGATGISELTATSGSESFIITTPSVSTYWRVVTTP